MLENLGKCLLFSARAVNRSEDREPLLNHIRTEGSVISDTGQFYSPLVTPEGW